MVKVPVSGAQASQAFRKAAGYLRPTAEGNPVRFFGQDITNLVNGSSKEGKRQEADFPAKKAHVSQSFKSKGHPVKSGGKLRRKLSDPAAGIFSRTRSRRKTGRITGKVIQSRIITRKGLAPRKQRDKRQDEAWITKGPQSGIESRPLTHLESLVDKKNLHVPAAVSLYHADIVDFLRTQEPSIRPLKSKSAQRWHISGAVPHSASVTDADYYDRTVLADWIAKVSREFALKDETLIISLNLLDRCIGCPTQLLKHTDPLLLAIGCMRVASKYEEILVNHIDDFLKLVQHSYSRKDIVSVEYAILECVDFRIVQPCHFTVTERIKCLLRIKEEDYQNAVVSQSATLLTKLGLVYGGSAVIHGDQFMLACAAGLLAAEKVYGANAQCLQKICEVMQLDLSQISHMVGALLSLLKQSVRVQPANPVRRTFLHRVGMGSGNSAEALLLK